MRDLEEATLARFSSETMPIEVHHSCADADFTKFGKRELVFVDEADDVMID